MGFCVSSLFPRFSISFVFYCRCICMFVFISIESNSSEMCTVFFVHSFIRCLKSRKKSHRINTHTHTVLRVFLIFDRAFSMSFISSVKCHTQRILIRLQSVRLWCILVVLNLLDTNHSSIKVPILFATPKDQTEKSEWF